MKEPVMSVLARASDEARPSAWGRVSRGRVSRGRVSRDRVEAFVALAAFAVLCIVVLSSASRLVSRTTTRIAPRSSR